ncbi:MAG TPA: hypothetical protein VKT28_15925 [Puia sp.]|nr:hypothetical protein [Puia sp.]
MFNIVEKIQENLGYSKLFKIDPNTQDIDKAEKSYGNNSLAQAGIPAVLCGLFNYVLLPEGNNISLFPANVKWLPLIFGDKLNEIIERIATYAGTSISNAKGELEHMADEAVRLLKQNIIVDNDMSMARKFSMEHKNDALSYLPGVLRTGEILGNNSIDDQTHKMQGPVSGLMHLFEKHFSSDNEN